MKKLSALLRRIISNHKEDFHSFIFFHSNTTKNKLEKHYKIVEMCRNAKRR